MRSSFVYRVAGACISKPLGASGVRVGSVVEPVTVSSGGFVGYPVHAAPVQALPSLPSLAGISVRTFATRPLVAVDSTSEGFTLVTPLPGVKGVVRMDLKKRTSTSELCARIREEDDTLDDSAEVTVLDRDTGNRVAGSTPLSTLMSSPWVLRVGDFEVESPGVESDSPCGMTPTESRSIYESVRSTLVGLDETTISYTDFQEIVRKAIATSETATSQSSAVVREQSDVWADLFHREGIILRFHESPDQRLRDMVFLQPGNMKDSIAAALTSLESATQSEIEKKEEELKAVDDEIDALHSTSDDVWTRSRRTVRVWAYGAGVFMCAQWALIFSKVYEISWDFMEPITYFIGVFYAVLAYVFFMITRKDPVTGNIFQQFVRSKAAGRIRGLGNSNYNSIESMAEYEAALYRSRSHVQRELAQLRSRIGK